MNTFRTIIFKLVLVIYFFVMSPFILISLVSKKTTRFVMTKGAKGVLWLLKKIAKVDYKIHFPTEDFNIPSKKNENIRIDRKVIIASKHSSILEVAVLETHIPNSFFILKRELLWIPIYGWAFWRMGLVPVNRKKGRTNMSKLATVVAEKIIQGNILIIFPEGTRTHTNSKINLKKGLLFLSEHLKLPIMPVSTDSGLYWPKKGIIKKGTANIYFEEILPSTATLEDISKSISRYKK